MIEHTCVMRTRTLETEAGLPPAVRRIEHTLWEWDHTGTTPQPAMLAAL